jgi:hypothetical protein
MNQLLTGLQDSTIQTVAKFFVGDPLTNFYFGASCRATLAVARRNCVAMLSPLSLQAVNDDEDAAGLSMHLGINDAPLRGIVEVDGDEDDDVDGEGRRASFFNPPLRKCSLGIWIHPGLASRPRLFEIAFIARQLQVVREKCSDDFCVMDIGLGGHFWIPIMIPWRADRPLDNAEEIL